MSTSLLTRINAVTLGFAYHVLRLAAFLLLYIIVPFAGCSDTYVNERDEVLYSNAVINVPVSAIIALIRCCFPFI